MTVTSVRWNLETAKQQTSIALDAGLQCIEAVEARAPDRAAERMRASRAAFERAAEAASRATAGLAAMLVEPQERLL